MSRRYSDADLERIARVQELTRQGLNLAGVARVLELETEIARLRTRLDEALDRSGSSTALVTMDEANRYEVPAGPPTGAAEQR